MLHKYNWGTHISRLDDALRRTKNILTYLCISYPFDYCHLKYGKRLVGFGDQTGFYKTTFSSRTI